MAHAGGRPRKFKSVEELQEKIDAYFAECDPHWVLEEYYEWDTDRKIQEKKEKWELSKQIPYTITGLALALDTTRDVLLDYENSEDLKQFSYTIKMAKAKVHSFVERRLFDQASTGAIFNLKNNFGWVDKNESVVRNVNTEIPLEELNDDEDIQKMVRKK